METRRHVLHSHEHYTVHTLHISSVNAMRSIDLGMLTTRERERGCRGQARPSQCPSLFFLRPMKESKTHSNDGEASKKVVKIVCSFLPDLDRFRLGVVDQTFRNDKGRGAFVGTHGRGEIYNLLDAFQMIKERKDKMDTPRNIQNILKREDCNFRGEVKSSWFTVEQGYDMLELVKVSSLCILGDISVILCV